MVEVFPSCNRLLPGSTLPLYYVPGSPDICWYWEQRHWLHAVGCQDPINFRKLERRRLILERIISDHSLAAQDVARPGEAPAGVGTLLLSTRCLLAWLLTKRAVTDTSMHQGTSVRWRRCIAGFEEELQDWSHTTEPPQIRIHGHVVLVVERHALVDLGPLARSWPTLPYEWQQLRDRSGSISLLPFPVDAKVSLVERR